MNNIKSIITKGGIQISIYTSVQYYECLLSYTIIYIYFIMKECSSVKSLLVLTYPHHESVKF